MSRYIDKFITYLEVEKNYSPHTVLNYRIDLEECGKFSGATPLENLDYLTLRRFLAHLRAQNFRPRTLARKMSSLRSFYRFLQREGLVKNNPASLLMSPKLDKTLPKFLTEEDMSRFIEAPKDAKEPGRR